MSRLKNTDVIIEIDKDSIGHNPFNRIGFKKTPYVDYLQIKPTNITNNLNTASVFSNLDNNYIRLLKQNKSCLIFNLSHEGKDIALPYLNIIKRDIKEYGLSEQNIFFLTGDLSLEKETDFQNIFCVNNYSVVAATHLLKYAPDYDRIKSLNQNYVNKYFSLIARRLRNEKAILIKHFLSSELLTNNCIYTYGMSGLDGEQQLDRIKCEETKQFFKNNKIFYRDLGSKYKSSNELATCPLDDIMSQVLFDAVVETSPHDQFFTEKTFRPISLGMPLIIYGHVGVNHQIADFGFKTYHEWFNLDFDFIEDHTVRMEAYLHELERVTSKLMLMNRDQQIEWSLKNTEILNHNRNLLINNPYFFNQISTLVDAINHTNPIGNKR